MLLAGMALPALAHTLPISYLRLVAEAEYLHLELVFNPFELSFMPDLDENRDAELNLAELGKHGQTLAERVVGALQLSAGGSVLRSETAGMDPDLSGHHVRVRAHYKLDARKLPLTVETGLPKLTSMSHLTQVTYQNGAHQQLAQLDSHSRKVTFHPNEPSPAPDVRTPPRQRAMSGHILVAGTGFLLLAGAALVWVLRKQRLR